MINRHKRLEPVRAGSKRDTEKQQRPANNTANPWWRVIAIAANGRRTSAGLFRSRADAERHASQLRGIASITDGTAIVEVAT